MTLGWISTEVLREKVKQRRTHTNTLCIGNRQCESAWPEVTGLTMSRRVLCSGDSSPLQGWLKESAVLQTEKTSFVCRGVFGSASRTAKTRAINEARQLLFLGLLNVMRQINTEKGCYSNSIKNYIMHARPLYWNIFRRLYPNAQPSRSEPGLGTLT